jgi:DNA-directed RNA polymerase specialized sigma24 family protein
MQLEDINAAFTEKVKRGMFNPVARHVVNHPDAEDRLQDAICQVWQMYRSRIEDRDLVLDDPILVHACRQRAVDLARHFVPSGGTRRYCDAMNQRAYRDGRVEVLRFDSWTEDDAEDESRPQQIGLAEQFCQSPERKMISALDLEDWLADLSAQNYGIMEGRMAGFSLPRIATDLGLSTSTIFARAKKLGLELASRAGVSVDLTKTRASRPRQKRAMLDAE